VNEKINILIEAKDEHGSHISEHCGELDAFFTGPLQKVLKFHAEKTMRTGFFVVHFQTDIVGEWRSMVRFNGVNVQPRSAKLKVVKKKNRFQVSVQNARKDHSDSDYLTEKEFEKKGKKKVEEEDESVDYIPELKRSGVKKLNVTVIKGKDLIAKNLTTNSSNPYVRVLAEGKQKRKTLIVKSSLNPQWRYKMEFDLRPCLAAKLGASIINFRCFNSESVGADTSMGLASVDLKKTKLPFRGNLDLQPEKGKKASGFIEVKIEVENDNSR